MLHELRNFLSPSGASCRDLSQGSCPGPAGAALAWSRPRCDPPSVPLHPLPLSSSSSSLSPSLPPGPSQINTHLAFGHSDASSHLSCTYVISRSVLHAICSNITPCLCDTGVEETLSRLAKSGETTVAYSVLVDRSRYPLFS